MGELIRIEPQLLELGYQIIAISADKPESLQQSRSKLKPNYLLLSDSSMAGARAFGIAFRVDEKGIEVFKKYGVDLEAASGEKHHVLPVPSAYIVGTDGMIKFSYVNPDYKVRVNAEVLLAAARAALTQ